MNQRKIRSFVAAGTIGFIALAGCTPAETGNTVSSTTPVPAGEKYKLTATFFPLADLTARIAGEKAEVQNLVGDGEPHGFETSDPQKLARASESRAIISLGLGLDGWADDINAGEVQNYVVSGNIETHNGSGHSDEAGAGIDPHVWLSIRDTEVLAQNISDVIIGLDPDNADYYRGTTEATIKALGYRDELKTTVLSNVVTKTIVTADEALAYLANDYGLTQEGIADVADNEPGPDRIAEIEEYIIANNVHTLFVEELDSSSAINTIIADIKSQHPGYVLEQANLNALEGLSDEEIADGRDYFTVMQDNLWVLAKGLGFDDADI